MAAPVYDDARKRGDTAGQDELVHTYLSHSDAVFAYAEQLSRQIMGYEPKQILLLHANQLEADHIGELLEVMRKRGYRFISLEEALADPAYSLPDTYVGEDGTGWLDHWAITMGKPPQRGPEFPQWVIDRSRALRQPQP
jgi:peptidoglycan-N-acetylglucosamine deacetylase